MKKGKFMDKSKDPLSRVSKTKRKRDWHPMINI